MNTQQRWAQLVGAISRPEFSSHPQGLLRQAVDLGLEVAPDAVGCSITAIDEDDYYTPVASGPLALDLDRAQYEAGNGPCMAAARTRQHQRFDAELDQDRFPGFAPAALDRGVLSSVSVPLLGTGLSSALNIYASSKAVLDDQHAHAVADLLARCVAALMAPRPAHHIITPAESLGPGPLEAARSRGSVVARAQAQLMLSRQLDQATAFTVLTRRSRAEDRSVLDIAHEVVGAAGGEAGK